MLQAAKTRKLRYALPILIVILAIAELGSNIPLVKAMPNADSASNELVTGQITRFDQPKVAWTKETDGGTCCISLGKTAVYTVGTLGVSRYDFAGNLVWASGTSWFVQSIAVGSDGVYVAEGLVVQKYDFNGNRIWTIPFSESPWASVVAANSVAVYVAGRTYANYSFVTKYDSEGNRSWTVRIPNKSCVTSQVRCSPFQDETALSVGPNAVYALGYTSCYLPSVQTLCPYDALLVAIDFTGHLLWSQEISSVLDPIVFFLGLSAAPGGVYVSGQTSFQNNGEGFVRKYDVQGNVVWIQEFQSNVPSGVATGNAGVYVIGSANCSSFLSDCDRNTQHYFVTYLDSRGNQVWTLQFGIGDYTHFAHGVSASTEGVFLRTGGGFMTRICSTESSCR